MGNLFAQQNNMPIVSNTLNPPLIYTKIQFEDNVHGNKIYDKIPISPVITITQLSFFFMAFFIKGYCNIEYQSLKTGQWIRLKLNNILINTIIEVGDVNPTFKLTKLSRQPNERHQKVIKILNEMTLRDKLLWYIENFNRVQGIRYMIDALDEGKLDRDGFVMV